MYIWRYKNAREIQKYTYKHIYVNIFGYIYTHKHTCGWNFCSRLLDGQLLGIPFKEAKQLRIKGAFKKIKPTGQMGTLGAQSMLRKRAQMKNCFYSVICLVHVKTQKLTKHCRKWILGVIFIYVDMVLSTYILWTDSTYRQKVHYGLKLLPIGTLIQIYQTSKNTEYSRIGTNILSILSEHIAAIVIINASVTKLKHIPSC